MSEKENERERMNDEKKAAKERLLSFIHSLIRPSFLFPVLRPLLHPIQNILAL